MGMITERLAGEGAQQPVAEAARAGEWNGAANRGPGRRFLVRATTRLVRSGLGDVLARCDAGGAVKVVTRLDEVLDLCCSVPPDVAVIEVADDEAAPACELFSAIARLDVPVTVVALASGRLAEQELRELRPYQLAGLMSTRSPLAMLRQAVGLRPGLNSVPGAGSARSSRAGQARPTSLSGPTRHRRPASHLGSGSPAGWGTAPVRALEQVVPVAAADRTSAADVGVEAGQVRLTAREREIVAGLGAGLTVSEIGDRLRISPKTIENHKQRLYAKLGVRNQAHAVVTAVRTGAVSFDGDVRYATSRSAGGARLVIGDRSRLIRDLTAGACRKQGLDVVAEASTPAEVLAACRARGPDIVLLSEPLAGESAESTVRVLAGMGIHVLVLAERWSPERALRALDAGASGYLMHDSTTERIAAAVAAVAGGGGVLDPRVTRLLLGEWRQSRTAVPAPGNTLTPREREVLATMAAGLGSKAIAAALGMAVKTVENHKRHIFDKLGARTQAHAVSIAMAKGIVLFDESDPSGSAEPRGTRGGRGAPGTNGAVPSAGSRLPLATAR